MQYKIGTTPHAAHERNIFPPENDEDGRLGDRLRKP